jgi:hypothetical protein
VATFFVPLGGLPVLGSKISSLDAAIIAADFSESVSLFNICNSARKSDAC